MPRARKDGRPIRSAGDGGLYQRKSDGLWIGAVTLPARMGGEQRRLTVSSKSKATAIEKLRKLRDEVADGRVDVTDRTTVKAWMEHWLDEIKRPTLRPNTLKSYRSSVNNQIIPHIGDRTLGSLTPAHIRELRAAILASGRAPKTADLAHVQLSEALSDAMREGLIKRNVCTLVTKPPSISKKRGTLTAEQARRLLVSMMESGDETVTRVATALITGARQGELLGLQWSRVDFEERIIDLEWQLQRLPLRKGVKRDALDRYDVKPGFEYIPLVGAAALTRPKTEGSQRIVPMDDRLAQILESYKRTARPNVFDLVWTNTRGRPIHSDTDTAALRVALERAGLPRLDMHSARHTNATLLLEAGTDTRVISEILGHSSAITTRLYQHVDTRLSRAAIGRLALLPDPSSAPKSEIVDALDE